MITTARTPRPTSYPKHQPGLLRNLAEKTGGVVGAVAKLPLSIVSGTAVGGYHGRKRGVDATVTTDPKKVAMQMFVGNALQSTAIGAMGALAVSGPAGAAGSVAKDVATNAVKYALYKKFGKPGSMSKRIATSVDKHVKGGEGATPGTVKGVLAGGSSAAVGGAVMGFRNGAATVSGAIEGVTEFDDEWKAAERPSGGPVRKVLTVAGGAVAGTLSAPVGLVQGLTARRTEGGKLSRKAQFALSAASGAALGGAAGLLGGPIGAVIGAGVGAVIGLTSSLGNKGLADGVSSSLQRATKNDTDMGNEESNARRDLLQNAIVGAAAGVRQGWDSVVRFGGS